jgi:hypothetical protein
MTTATLRDLADREQSEIRVALTAVFGANRDLDIGVRDLRVENDCVLVPVRPTFRPEPMMSLMEGIADAEVRLRDAGMRVRLVPDVRRREVVVAWGNANSGVAFISTDGEEWQDLAEALGISEAAIPSFTMYETFAYDTDEERSDAISDAKRQHPKADFSRVQADDCEQRVLSGGRAIRWWHAPV